MIYGLGRPARTRVWAVAGQDGGREDATQLAVQLTAPVSDDAAEQAVQRTLHLRWLGCELLTDA